MALHPAQFLGERLALWGHIGHTTGLESSGFTRVRRSGHEAGRERCSGPLGPVWRPLKISSEGPFSARFAAVKLVLTSTLMAVAISGASLAFARGPMDGVFRSGAATVLVTELPRQGRETYERIRMGGPFTHDKDGAVFGNRERLLPIEKRGYYREYTVPTPGSRDRGARRIVCGGPARKPHACYYTADHYFSFRLIVE
jgi:ribonuclease T1